MVLWIKNNNLTVLQCMKELQEILEINTTKYVQDICGNVPYF